VHVEAGESLIALLAAVEVRAKAGSA
jgi:hypothetical protein